MTRTRVNKGASAQLTGTVVDKAGVAVDGSRVSGAKLTLYDVDTYDPSATPFAGIINSRQQDEVFAASPTEMTIDSVGAYVLTLQAADNPLVTARRQAERHLAALIFTYDTGVYEETQEITVIGNEAS